MNKEILREWLLSTDIPISAISRKCNISRNTLYSWMNNNAEIRDSNASKVFSVYTEQISKRGGSEVNMSTGEILDIYKENRKLRLQVDELKDEARTSRALESIHWDVLPYDFLVDVKLTRNGWKFGRCIHDVTEFNVQTKELGYSIEELKEKWSVGVNYNRMEEHPIDTILDKKCIKALRKQIKTLPALFDTMKHIIGDHYIPQPIIFKHKDGGRVFAISYNKVHWKDLSTISKVKFLLSS